MPRPTIDMIDGNVVNQVGHPVTNIAPVYSTDGSTYQLAQNTSGMYGKYIAKRVDNDQLVLMLNQQDVFVAGGVATLLDAASGGSAANGVPLYVSATEAGKFTTVNGATTSNKVGYVRDATNIRIDVTPVEAIVSVGGLQNNYAATTNPTATDDSNAGYSVGSFWINTSIGAIFKCTDSSVGAAVWERIDEERVSLFEKALNAELDAAYHDLNDGTGTYANKKTYESGKVEFEVYHQLFAAGTTDGLIKILASDGVTILESAVKDKDTEAITTTYNTTN